MQEYLRAPLRAIGNEEEKRAGRDTVQITRSALCGQARILTFLSLKPAAFASARA